MRGWCHKVGFERATWDVCRTEYESSGLRVALSRPAVVDVMKHLWSNLAPLQIHEVLYYTAWDATLNRASIEALPAWGSLVSERLLLVPCSNHNVRQFFPK